MINPTRSVAETVLDHSVCAEVFQRHRIDFCCRGELSIDAAAKARGVDPKGLLAELEAAVAQRNDRGETDPRQVDTAALIDHIVAAHHGYLRQSLPFIEQLAAKVARVHGPGNPKLIELNEAVVRLARALVPHLDEEEQVLFPALLGASSEVPVAAQLASMREEHELVAGLLEEIRAAADDFVYPGAACNSYRTLFHELQQLERDTFTHVHLENHVLLPRFQDAEDEPSGAPALEPTTVSAYLEADHDRLDRLAAATLAAAKAGDFDAARQSYEKFQVGLDRHIELEEQVLFPVFDRITGMAGGGPVAVMRMEHQAIHVEMRGVKEALDAADGPGVEEGMDRLSGILGPHNEKEEQVLYPMTDEALGDTEDRRALVEKLVAY